MYRCRLCHAVSPPGKPLFRWTVYREVRKIPLPVHGGDGPTTRKEIEAELPVCAGCLAQLESDTPLARLLRPGGGRKQTTAPDLPTVVLRKGRGGSS